MKIEHKPFIEDIQARKDHRNISIDKVGVCDLKIPVIIKGCEMNPESEQNVQALLNLSVNLSSEQKGIHMSRLVESALEYSGSFSLNEMGCFLFDLCERQEAESACVRMQFDYFFRRSAPVSGKMSPQPYTCIYSGEIRPEGLRISQNVLVPVKTLCPCSKEISDYGAHNQRSKISVNVICENLKEDDPINICLEEIIGIAERGASSPLYPILKREDERHITMSAYNKPCFVEDVVRNMASELHSNSKFDFYELRVINYESIHSHNAFAVIAKRPTEKTENL